MARPNYRIQLTREDWDKLHAGSVMNAQQIDVAPDIAKSELDPKVRADANTYTIEIDDYAYGDFNNIHRRYKDAIYRCTSRPVNGAPAWMDTYGTEAFRKEQLDLIIQSREELRGIQGPVDDPNTKLDLTDSTAAGATGATLKNSRGICMGHGHSQKAAYKYLVDMANNPGAFGKNGGMLFVEELPAYLQSEVDDYLAADVEPQWSEKAQTFFDSVTKGRELKVGEKLEDMLKAARQNNIKVVSIDSGECSPSTVPTSAFGEQRDCNMNAFGKRAMDKAIRENPERTFVVFCGAAHSNTHEGGIPGFAQIYDIPAVTMKDNGTVEPDDEDRSLRGMPPKELQVFVDQFLVDYENERKANRVPGTEYPDPAAIKTDVMKMATNLFNAGKLPDPNLSNDDLRLATQQLTAKIPKGKTQRYEATKDAVATGGAEDLDLFLTFEPEMVFRRDPDGKTKGKNLLSHAMDAGAKNATDLIRTHMETVGDGLAESGTIGLEDMAELIVVKASGTARNGDGSTEMNGKKYREMVQKLSKTLGNNVDKLGDKSNVVNHLSSKLATDGGFYKKPNRKFVTREPDHVSIDKKKSAKIWIRELALL